MSILLTMPVSFMIYSFTSIYMGLELVFVKKTKICKNKQVKSPNRNSDGDSGDAGIFD